MDAGLLVLRIVVGLLLVGHGAQKLFGWFGGGGLNGTAWYFRSVGYRPPRLMAGFAGAAELVGGAALAAGFMTPLAASAVIGTMLNASVAVHRRNGLWAVDNGYEYPLVVATAALTLSFTGAGAASLDARLGLGGPSIEAGLFAVTLGLVAGSAALLSRAAMQRPGGKEPVNLGRFGAYGAFALQSLQKSSTAFRRSSEVRADGAVSSENQPQPG